MCKVNVMCRILSKTKMYNYAYRINLMLIFRVFLSKLQIPMNNLIFFSGFACMKLENLLSFKIIDKLHQLLSLTLKFKCQTSIKSNSICMHCVEFIKYQRHACNLKRTDDFEIEIILISVENSKIIITDELNNKLNGIMKSISK